MEIFFKKKILLASQSPRRQQLIRDSGFDMEVVHLDVDENFSPNLKGAQIPLFLAEKKNLNYDGDIGKDEVLVTADTVVWLEDQVLNKPADMLEAYEMLRKLSGKKHTVYTAVCLRSNKDIELFDEATDVYFNTLSDDMIQYYLRNYKPLDKAGAYGIQEFIGYAGIKRIEGCYYNVMGFPVSRFIKELKTFSI
ncbi:MAG: septum formation protein Maf [Bacteroidetes bacterium]|nr:septum formation protein Maf [Bacteroidota bacterium]